MTVVMDGCFGQGPATTGFIPRAPRISLRIPVIFDFSGGRAQGQSVDISESGVLAVFDQRLDVWLVGQLWLLAGEERITIEACIARVSGLTAALSFRSMSMTDRTRVQNLIKDPREEST
jgi:hypothetical protein